MPRRHPPSRHRTGSVALGVILVALIGAIVVVASHPLSDAEALRRLEARAIAIPVTQAGYHAPISTDRYHDAQRLSRITVRVLGATIAYTKDGMPGDLDGMAVPSARMITINPSLAWDARFQVLAHEAAHVIQPSTLATSEAEVFADAVSYLTGRRYGYDDLETIARYLASHKQALSVLRVYATEISWAALVLTGPE